MQRLPLGRERRQNKFFCRLALTAALETTQCCQTVAAFGVAAAEEFGVEENLDAFERRLRRLHDIGAEHQYVCIVMFA